MKQDTHDQQCILFATQDQAGTKKSYELALLEILSGNFPRLNSNNI
jgi:hypothetical protein